MPRPTLLLSLRSGDNLATASPQALTRVAAPYAFGNRTPNIVAE
jgi:hypothetical protein